MKKLLFILIILNIVVLYSIEYKEYDAFSQPYIPCDSTSINQGRLMFLIGSVALSVTGSYYAVKTAWWYEQSVDFHFDNGADLRYSKNLDKVAHLYGGYISQDIYYRSLLWSNVEKEKALWTSFGLSCFLQVMIDVKDAYAPDWGFSMYDVGVGVMGASYPVLQYYYPYLNNFSFKMSYYYREDGYTRYVNMVPENWLDEAWIEDYPNQTYWLCWNVNSVLPKEADKYWPDFLDLAIGMSVDDQIDAHDNGNVEIYLAFDYDLEELVKNIDSPIVKSIAHYLNYIKFPSPAIKFTPKFKAYGIYF